jgi:hypothetical protein
MKTVHSKQNWKGFFSYLEGYDTAEQYLEVEFSMEIMFEEESFTGTFTSSESKHVFNEPAKVKGFVEDDKISFILKYPFSFFKDENGNFNTDKATEHPEIHYLGFFNEDKSMVEGNWEMAIIHDQSLSEFTEEIFNGKFEMRRS